MSSSPVACGQPLVLSDTQKSRMISYARALEDFARDWDATFENRPSYFTQEFWYLLVSCLLAQWQGRPLSVGQACHCMKSGSNRTREDRINRAVDDGYLFKEKANEDGRTLFVLPTHKLEQIMIGHLTRTMKKFETALEIVT